MFLNLLIKASDHRKSRGNTQFGYNIYEQGRPGNETISADFEKAKKNKQTYFYQFTWRLGKSIKSIFEVEANLFESSISSLQ